MEHLSYEERSVHRVHLFWPGYVGMIVILVKSYPGHGRWIKGISMRLGGREKFSSLHG
jgi:hypothetical protein